MLMNPTMRIAPEHKKNLSLLSEVFDVDTRRIHPDGWHGDYPQYSLITRRKKHYRVYVQEQKVFLVSGANND